MPNYSDQSMTRQHVHIMKTGGTIEFHDPAYEAINMKLMKVDSTIDSYLENVIQPHFDVSTEVICRKDSRDLTNDDRAQLAKGIQSTSHENILVTHGTFTLVETVRYLVTEGFADKKIIVTGSMIPISGFSTSDAGFNLGFAIGSFPSLDPGVYIAMNGGVFSSDEVEKNVEAFRFE